MSNIDWPLLIGATVMGLLAAGLWAKLWRDDSECPRAIVGYNCKGRICDHSQEALSAAYQAVGKVYYRR